MKRMLSGIKPSGSLTLGNYIGAIKPFSEYQKDYEMFLFVADLHALTVFQDKKELKKNTKDLVAIYLAAGLDPSHVTLFLQSDVMEHAQLGFILTCQTSMGELARMTQYKDKVAKNEVIGTGIFIYPGLMAADILVYNPDYVPVGDDQKQHVELTRDLAERFNSHYGQTFKVPEPVIVKSGARIMSLQEPTKKMSKSDGKGFEDKGCIYLLEPIASAKKKIKSAVTDSESHVHYDVINKPGVSNLMTIYHSLTGLSYEDIERKYEGLGYGAFKGDLAEIVGDALQTLQDNYQAIIEQDLVSKVLKEGALKAKPIASRTLLKVHTKLGIGID